MSKRDFFVLISASILGFVSGRLGSQTHSAEAVDNTVQRATRFELVDASSKEIAFLGADSKQNTVMAFLDENQRNIAVFGLRGRGSVASPFLAFSGKDGKPRINMELVWMDRPVFAMSDEKWEGRVLLGFMQSDSPDPTDADWALAFRYPDVASIGVMRDPQSGSLRGSLAIHGRNGKNLYFPPPKK